MRLRFIVSSFFLQFLYQQLFAFEHAGIGSGLYTGFADSATSESFSSVWRMNT